MAVPSCVIGFPQLPFPKDALRHGQRPTAELVDFYNLQSTPVRNLLVRYVEERRPGVDRRQGQGEKGAAGGAGFESHRSGPPKKTKARDRGPLAMFKI